jgi:uncharacterized membrane protein
MRRFKIVMKYLLALLFISAGAHHFRHPEVYMRIMPPYLPWPSALHLTAGFFEIALGFLLLIPRYQKLAAWGLVALLLAVYPANIHMAVHHELYPEHTMLFHWIRLPLQFVLMAWAWWFTRPDGPKGGTREHREDA